MYFLFVLFIFFLSIKQKLKYMNKYSIYLLLLETENIQYEKNKKKIKI